MDTKRCSKCGEEKPVGMFYKRKYVKKDGTQALDSWCKACRNIYQRTYASKNKGKIAARMKAAYDADPERYREKIRKWREKNKDKLKEYYRKWRDTSDRFVVVLQNSVRHARKCGYKPCDATVEEIKEAFTGKCFVCGVPEAECTKPLHLDHNHETGDFRGWLCKKCNTGIGMFGDSEDLLLDALHYLMGGAEIK